MNELVLLESRTARQDRLTDLDDTYALETINKAKALLMAMWKGESIATTAQMAEYYEVPQDTVQTVLKRNREELASDGVKTLKGKQLIGMSIMDKPQDGITVLTIWTPRAALRLGMLLRDSLVAQKVRTILLDVAERQTDDYLLQKQVSQLVGVVTNLALSVSAIVEPRPKNLPKESIDPVPAKMVAMTERQCINRLIRNYVSRKNQGLLEGSEKETQQQVTRWMYRELKIRYKFDVYARFKNSTHKSKIDLIEAEGRLPQLHAICNHFLGQ